MANKACRERVTDSGHVMSRNCANPAGHGPDGDYCALHAERFEDTKIVLWEIDRSDPVPKAVKAVKATEKMVWTPERRARVSYWARYFDTLEEALKASRERLEREREELNRRIEENRADFARLAELEASRG